LETAIAGFTQNRDDGFGVMAVRWGDIDRHREVVFLNRRLDLAAADLLAAIDAARTTARRRATGATVDDRGARFWGIAACNRTFLVVDTSFKNEMCLVLRRSLSEGRK
jgi:hypothetical protein